MSMSIEFAKMSERKDIWEIRSTDFIPVGGYLHYSFRPWNLKSSMNHVEFVINYISRLGFLALFNYALVEIGIKVSEHLTR